VQRQPTEIEAFTFDATLPDEKTARRVHLYHAIVRDGRAGVTVSATLTAANPLELQREISRMLTGLRVGR
jgi:hypothetical protein